MEVRIWVIQQVPSRGVDFYPTVTSTYAHFRSELAVYEFARYNSPTNGPGEGTLNS